ncbi:DNA-binding transcriptional regulator, MarR family [Cohnella sp. OV330]|uniref:MarR family winged helix-turn-helix transcriptional regulator n=1 Tax=Cohnella sp. OV330 TaxID=1855288 RepID=UPI0008F407C1|nr:MarR family transcriptional regulator [Cohnella sp. OV330]SFB46929.1 DNA-binding transcriptional regulator, MarR family [Cohnella sp. OV330]
MSHETNTSIELEIALLIRRLTSISTSRKFGTLDRSAYLLLGQIESHGSAGVKALAEEFRLDISTVSRQTSALEQKGYVYKMPDPEDGRAYFYQLTDEGRRMLEETRQQRTERIDELLKDWSEDERTRFGELLAKFNRTYLDD